MKIKMPPREPGMTPSTSNSSSASFPAGLRVMVVDDDRTTLRLMERLLQECSYNPTCCNNATDALTLLLADKTRFDLVISDVHMPDMDGFKLLEHIGLALEIPVIMMSGDGDTQNVMKGITHGACDYLMKPVRLQELGNIWQHVVRRRKSLSKQPEPSSPDKASDQATTSKKRSHPREEDEEPDPESEETSLKKPRVVWSPDLHASFVEAVRVLGMEKAVPKKILEVMNSPELTRENVASHLQKYRMFLKRAFQEPQAATTGALQDPPLQFSGYQGGPLALPGNYQPHPMQPQMPTFTSPSDPVLLQSSMPMAPRGLSGTFQLNQQAPILTARNPVMSQLFQQPRQQHPQYRTGCGLGLVQPQKQQQQHLQTMPQLQGMEAAGYAAPVATFNGGYGMAYNQSNINVNGSSGSAPAWQALPQMPPVATSTSPGYSTSVVSQNFIKFNTARQESESTADSKNNLSSEFGLTQLGFEVQDNQENLAPLALDDLDFFMNNNSQQLGSDQVQQPQEDACFGNFVASNSYGEYDGFPSPDLLFEKDAEGQSSVPSRFFPSR